MRYKGDLSDEFWETHGRKYFKVCGSCEFYSFVPSTSELRTHVSGCMRRGCAENFRGLESVGSLYVAARRIFNLDLEKMKHGDDTFA